MKKITSIVFFLLFGVIFAQQQTHTIKANESIDHIAKTYRVSPSDIFKQNPGLKDSMKKGMVIVIPSGKVKYYSTQRPMGFIPHTVEAKETFFGLSQKYNITIDDIKRYNFDLYTRGLQEGELISIPIFSRATGTVEKGVQGQKKYVVKPQETLWRIAREHNISQAELEKMNRGVTASNLKDGQEIWVPAVESVASKPNHRTDLVPYAVEKAEGFYSLQRKFGLSEAELIKLNPELKDGVKADTQIWIPKENYNRYRYSITSFEEKSFPDSNQNVQSLSSTENVRQLSFVLPFRISDISEENKSAALRTRLGDNRATPMATDFYSGAMIALDSLQKMGYSFKVNVFDSENNNMKNIIADENLLNSQLIIGPFSAKSFNDLTKHVTNVAVLAPLSNRNIDLNPNVFQTLPTDEVQQNKMITYISENHSDANILILADSKNTAVRERLASSFPNAKIVTEVTAKSIPNAIDYNRLNFVLIQSNDIGYVSNAVRVLHGTLSLKKNDISPKIILATIDRGSVFDSNNISNNQLSDLQFTYPTFNKYSNGDDSFSQRYVKTYGVLPNRYAIRGFDITMDAVLRLGVTGNFEQSTSHVGETSYLENKFAYQRNPYKGGGYENQGVFIVKYENMEVKEVK
ncbi:LysM peptidoglycan-binding domain-containing protein [Capnocytophaga canis]|uniref:LysM peptidoglycan-binding domain-containing protein n=1 Tax=Capnocytophaga canis TaxID=1848903 RepID=UPI001ACD28EA|nr:LysM peptidoglycan-binding domain-containing protein [Capnocytophaga canis]GIM61506.1 hypothetical protein CAPN008_15560 [Capnocytophaga canis]